MSRGKVSSGPELDGKKPLGSHKQIGFIRWLSVGANLTPEVFESACQQHFEIVRRQHLENTHRWLYLLQRRGRLA
jgi:hypothetical protein